MAVVVYAEVTRRLSKFLALMVESYVFSEFSLTGYCVRNHQTQIQQTETD